MKSGRRQTVLVVLALAALVAVGLALRLAAIDLKGHYGDSIVMSRWAENMAKYGPWGFYRHDGAIYPALLYAYWPLGVLFDGADLARAIKGLSIPFDLAIGLVSYVVARSFVGPIRALIAPALYILNPAVVLSGPVWGQVDAAGTLAYLLALMAAAGRRFLAAGALVAVALLIKPQFGLVFLPVAVVVLIVWRTRRDWTVLAATVLGGILAFVLVTVPLALDPISYFGRVIGAGSFQETTTANAANIWALYGEYDQPDGSLVYVGGVLLVLGLVASLLPLRRRIDLPTILAVGLFVVLAFYFLPTRVHERYLFPAMAVLAPLATANWRVFGGYLFLTAGFTASMLFALIDETPFSLGPAVDQFITQPTGRIWISLAMIATAATLVLLLLRPDAISKQRPPEEVP
jgi:dolichyl-phosphate-mannose-protein mannosyltransferase